MRSDGKLLPAGKFNKAEDKYQEELRRLLAEGPKARFDRTIAQAIAEELPRMGLTPARSDAILLSTVSDEETMMFNMFLPLPSRVMLTAQNDTLGSVEPVHPIAVVCL